MPGLRRTLAIRLLDVDADSSALADDSPRLAARSGPTGAGRCRRGQAHQARLEPPAFCIVPIGGL
jgi:hypothetical protein